MNLARKALLLVFLPLAIGVARAEAVSAKLQVNAQVVVSCRLDARVPRVGTPERATGGASISVSCTKGALAAAHACPEGCIAPTAKDDKSREYHVAESRGDGQTIATLLF